MGLFRLVGTLVWPPYDGSVSRRGGLEDFQVDEDLETYFYPCPCGDNFCITKEDLENGEDVATCPSCSLIIKVIYDKEQFMCGETVPAPSTNKELVKC